MWQRSINIYVIITAEMYIFFVLYTGLIPLLIPCMI